MRAVLPVLAVLLSGCGWVEAERREAAEAARAETLAEVERTLALRLRSAERHARGAERILRPMPVMTPGEEAELRRFLNASHLARARELGVRAFTDASRDSLVDAGRLIALEDSAEHWIVRRGSSPAHVVPHTREALRVIGARFHARLSELGIPPYRMEVTSALRTAERQAALRRTNANAAAGVSTHEFGTTVDLSYAAFAPPAARPPEVSEGLSDGLRPVVERLVDLTLESVSARKSRELGRIFSSVLAEAQAEGLVLVIYERQQTVYHVTVASPLAS